MNIQEFSHQLERKEQPSRLIRALRALRIVEPAEFLGWCRDDWGIWQPDELRAGADPKLPA